MPPALWLGLFLEPFGRPIWFFCLFAGLVVESRREMAMLLPSLSSSAYFILLKYSGTGTTVRIVVPSLTRAG
jgi:hypothetical protein